MDNKYKINLSEILYICFFSIMLIAKGIGLYDGQTLYKITLVVAFLLAGVKMCITHYTKLEWLVIVLVGLLSVCVYFVSKEKGILICVLTVIALKNVSVKRLFNIGAWVWGITMVGTVSYFLMFLNQSGYKVHDKLGLGHIFRWSLGYSHPNILHVSYLVLAVFIIYNLGEKYDWKKLFLLMAGNIYIFLYSVSYTGFLIVAIYLVGSLYIVWRKKISKLEYTLVELVFPGCLAISFLAPLCLDYSSRLFYIINTIFNNRLYLAYFYLVPENVKLLGNNLAKLTTSMLTLDNSYLFSFIFYGVIVFACIVIVNLVVIHRYIKEKRNKELMIFVCFLITGITEPLLFNTSFKNLTLLFIGDCLLNNTKSFLKDKKTYAILPNVDRVVCLDLSMIYCFKEQFKDIWHKNKRKVVAGGMCIGAVCCIITLMVTHMPKGYVVPRVHSDVASKEALYVEDVSVYEEEGIQVLNYVDAETKMQLFGGNIVILEYIRKGVSSLLLFSSIGAGCILAYFYVK